MTADKIVRSSRATCGSAPYQRHSRAGAIKGNGWFGRLTIKGNGVVLLRNDPAILNRIGEFSMRPILKISKSGGFCLLLYLVLGYERPAQYHFLKQVNTCKGYASKSGKKLKDEGAFFNNLQNRGLYLNIVFRGGKKESCNSTACCFFSTPTLPKQSIFTSTSFVKHYKK